MRYPTPDRPLTTMEEIRNTRKLMLKDCDWTVGIDSPLSDAKKTEWTTYRQALRDLPNLHTNESNLLDVVYPNPPL
tara:strand:- start:5335 stop:5562 length:228 start_codon:yes stop_codon:yes gene_type:complete